MTPDMVIDLGRGALTVTVMLSAPLLLAALLTGLVVGLFQAATQINEQTLSFIPKLLSMVIVLIATGPWLLQTILDYTSELIVETVPRVLGG
ncbi:flagellar biosynthesis protein FliQ [Granulosicoccus antarcticus]|uniref:Flagellar biosynthetic protein FliQ n=1 Tax=Granulosicoccus antarcticus IMCC3135 TaxID=1192854 RepID=A0A2Z2NXA9_9GAMM|nr:flagellar biosynthesis protein FliQ [Granulosicoccus antarcticus]ASJ71784.1 Flagellar biosynthetic protein FliQ [Granulosicoccus antarcticus IMCC3135]